MGYGEKGYDCERFLELDMNMEMGSTDSYENGNGNENMF